jgi:hypothetical protein
MRRRDDRKAKALAFLRVRGRASALDIGAAAVRGEPWAHGPHTWKAKQEIGLIIAIDLARSGVLAPTRANEFEFTGSAE